MRKHVLLVATATVAALALTPNGPAALAAPGGQGQGAQGQGAQGQNQVRNDTRKVGPDYNKGKALKLSSSESEKATVPPVQGPTKVGDVKTWLALDDYENSIYLKNYTLRGVGDHIEVWVANNRAFPGSDCRNGLGLTNVSDAQVANFIHEFDTNIYPKESASFSVAPRRNGSKATLDELLSDPTNSKQKEQSKWPQDYWVGAADKTVVLVDNVRDANFYAPTTPSGQTYIAGFFYSVFNEYVDRNVMTIDVFDWLHRTGANPPDDSTNPDYAACTAALGATRAIGAPRPHLYEGVFAHEYQHLLEYYASPGEHSWINEGLSDYAQTLVGYVDPSVDVTSPTADSHLACFSGFTADKGLGGPENSLTVWGDQGDAETLCDYGAAYSFVQYLVGHYGPGIATALHNQKLNGIAGLNAVLAAAGSTATATDLIHRWAAMWALDHFLTGGTTLTGGDKAAYSEASLDAQINWAANYGDINHDGTFDDPGNEAYSTPGAPQNGSDYVRLTDGTNPLGAGSLTSLAFDAPATLAPDPVQWTVDTVDGNPMLYSGSGPNFDRSIVQQVAVPAGSPQLTFDTKWDTEQGWDFGFVQVSTDHGATWTSLANADTTSTHDPDAIPGVVANLPGFTGQGGPKTETFDLSSYAGQTVLLSFRYITDSGVNNPGWWVDNVTVGGTLLPNGDASQPLDGSNWKSMTEINPIPVAGFTLQLVGYSSTGGTQAWIYDVPVTKASDGSFHAAMTTAELNAAVGTTADVVAALVMQDDPTETSPKYATYSLVVNGVLQPGGGA